MEIQDILRELEREIIDNKCNNLWEYFKHNGNLFSKEQLIGIIEANKYIKNNKIYIIIENIYENVINFIKSN